MPEEKHSFNKISRLMFTTIRISKKTTLVCPKLREANIFLFQFYGKTLVGHDTVFFSLILPLFFRYHWRSQFDLHVPLLSG